MVVLGEQSLPYTVIRRDAVKGATDLGQVAELLRVEESDYLMPKPLGQLSKLTLLRDAIRLMRGAERDGVAQTR